MSNKRTATHAELDPPLRAPKANTNKRRPGNQVPSQPQFAHPPPNTTLAPSTVGGFADSSSTIAPPPPSITSVMGSVPGAAGASVGGPAQKKSRTNTPWTPAEELRLKNMRDEGRSWAEIAKTFPARTEGSVKKHWYKVFIHFS